MSSRFIGLSLAVVVCVLSAVFVCTVLMGGTGAEAAVGAAPGDWPMWRFDAQRRAATPAALPASLSLQWTRQLPAPARAWLPQGEHYDKLDFDVSYSPVVMGQTLFVASMVQDTVTAYDTRTGAEKWRFYSDGPMRLAPAAHNGRVYAVSDDGFLYCLDADTGEEHWRFRGGPDDRRLLGNARLVNMWAARGAPVIRDGVVYFAASFWPLMGTFIHALDAETGTPIWSNTGSGAHYNLHQHGGAYAFGGVAPQGYLAATDALLLVSGGRTVPAVHDRATGAFKYYEQASRTVGKGRGGYRVAVQDDWFHNHDIMYSLEDGAQFDSLATDVLTDEALYVVARREDDDGEPYYRLEAYAPTPDEDPSVEIEDRLERGELRKRFDHNQLWAETIDVPLERLHLKAGNRVYGSGADGLIAAVELPRDGAAARVAWQTTVDGDVWEMLAADARLFVVTHDGAIHCFGGDAAPQPAVLAEETRTDGGPDDATVARAATLLEEAGVSGGYAIMFGAGDDNLAEALIQQSDLHLVVVEPNADTVAAMRRRFSDLDLYGRRLAVHAGTARDFDLPAYMAELIVVEDMDAVGALDTATAERLFHPLRPYGGMAMLPLDDSAHDAFAEAVAQAELANARVARADAHTTLQRPGALPGAGQWTHQYADTANTSYSPDQRTKAPLGLLWYGGPCNANILPRHGQGPIPHVVEGRTILPGVDTMSARDVYTGRDLWVRDFPGIGHPFTNLELEARYEAGESVYMTNLPGANFIGSFYASAPDGIYVRYEGEILRLAPATGETLSAFPVAPPDDNNDYDDYGHISVWEELLITSAEPQYFDDEPIGDMNWNATSSNKLVVRNRHTGDILWSRDAEIGFRHNTIIIGNGTLFVVDGQSEDAMQLYERRGLEPDVTPRLLALDARTGELRWESNDNVFGTFLMYAEEHDLLLQKGRHGGKRVLPDEPNRPMIAHCGNTGEVAWERGTGYSGPASLLGDIIVPGRPGPLVDLLTGEMIEREHPLTAESLTYAYHRTYGCGTLNVSEHLLLFRSGAAGYTDMHTDAGTGNLSGFRAGCTNNLIAADGVLNAPDYTRTCTCAYQNQTSLALIHMPDVEMWTYNQITRGREPIKRAGVNLAAPGNHMADTGVLWIEHPRVGGPAPEVPVVMEPEDCDWFRTHASLMDTAPDAISWVAGSGVLGLNTLHLELDDDENAAPRNYTVRLHFSEPEDVQPGQRVFDVYVQNQLVLEDFDVVAEAGAPKRGIMHAFSGVNAADTLRIDLRRREDTHYPTLLCGVEVILEDDDATLAARQ